jgi:hypothetical protein
MAEFEDFFCFIGATLVPPNFVVFVLQSGIFQRRGWIAKKTGFSVNNICILKGGPLPTYSSKEGEFFWKFTGGRTKKTVEDSFLTQGIDLKS